MEATLVILNCLVLVLTSAPVRAAPAVSTVVEDRQNQKVEKRSAAPVERFDDYPDYQIGVKYDEYPMVVPKKRTAILVNRLMNALKDALDEDERDEFAIRRTNRVVPPKNFVNDDIRGMDLQRRGHGNSGMQKGRLYWRCYFNAVTCF